MNIATYFRKLYRMVFYRKLNRLTSAQLNATTVLFLLAAPIVVILYGSFVFNPMHADNWIMYLLHVVADMISIVVLLSLWLTILLDVLIESHHRILSPNENDYLFKSHPTVDVFITVAGEPIEIVSETIQAAVDMDYPHEVFVLDDGKSAQVKAICEKVGANYITRTNKEFAKSGNLNNGLRYSEAEFFVIFDADQVPKKNFLIQLLPHMANDNIGMVQSPQFYGNTHEFIANGTAQAQEIFYKHVCPAKNVTNSAFCVGTNVLFRREAIDQIGGVAQVGHSEDIWTSRLLHEKGWQTLFVNEVLAVGRAPATVASFFKQQLRWSKGGLSMMFLQNPLLSKHLSIDQKIHYFSANFFYLCGFAILAYLVFPLAYLLFGVKALQTESGLIWLLHYLPYFGLYYSLTWLLLGKLHISTIATSMASFYPYILAFVTVIFGTKIRWVATTTNRVGSLDMQWVWPHVLLIILTLFALIIGWYEPTNFWTTFYNTVWALFNLYLLVIFITAETRKVARSLV